jgi:hypothetical protein
MAKDLQMTTLAIEAVLALLVDGDPVGGTP